MFKWLVGLGVLIAGGAAIREHYNDDRSMQGERETQPSILQRIFRLRGKEQPGEPPVIKSLRADAAEIAAAFAGHLGVEVLKAPLQTFLSCLGAASPPGLEGIALAAWESRYDPSHLSLYALVNETQQTEIDSGSTDTAIFAAHNELRRRLEANIPPLSCGLSFINTRGKDLSALSAELRRRLESAEGPFATPIPVDERISLLTIAKAA